MFSKIRNDLNRRILYESMRPEQLQTMARVAMENPHYVRTIRPRTPTWDFPTWMQEHTHFVGPPDPSFILHTSRFNRIFQHTHAIPPS